MVKIKAVNKVEERLFEVESDVKADKAVILEFLNDLEEGSEVFIRKRVVKNDRGNRAPPA